MRRFESGATRDTDENKNDYEGFLSPMVIECFGNYMTKHRKQADGNLRASDNWQKGIPKSEYLKSAWRHYLDWWKEHRGIKSKDGLIEALCALMFNVMGYLFEVLKEGMVIEKNEWCECKKPIKVFQGAGCKKCGKWIKLNSTKQEATMGLDRKQVIMALHQVMTNQGLGPLNTNLETIADYLCQKFGTKKMG